MTPDTPRATAAVRVVDDIPGLGFGWIAPEPAFMQRASHAIAADGRVWLFDPVWDEGMLERASQLGEPAGVIQQLDRHPRDGARIATEFGVPLHVLPASPPSGAPFEVLPVISSRLFRWHEIAVRFSDPGILLIAEAVGGAPYFCVPGQAMGPHPLLRLVAPPRCLVGAGCDHVVFGHGQGAHGPDTSARLDAVIRDSRRGIPRWAGGLMRRGRG